LDRIEFASLLGPELKVLELSPFTAPVVAGKNVCYADILDTENLILRAEEVGLDPSRVVPVDFLIDTSKHRHPFLFMTSNRTPKAP
jgi:hypothetical protein